MWLRASLNLIINSFTASVLRLAFTTRLSMWQAHFWWNIAPFIIEFSDRLKISMEVILLLALSKDIEKTLLSISLLRLYSCKTSIMDLKITFIVCRDSNTLKLNIFFCNTHWLSIQCQVTQEYPRPYLPAVHISEVIETLLFWYANIARSSFLMVVNWFLYHLSIFYEGSSCTLVERTPKWPTRQNSCNHPYLLVILYG
jgi:hypothetical protein